MTHRDNVPAFNIKLFADQELANKNTDPQVSLRPQERLIERPVVRSKNKSATSLFKWESITNIYCKNEELNRMIERHIESTSHEALIEKIEKKMPSGDESPGFRKVSELIHKVRKSVKGPSLLIRETSFEGEEIEEDKTRVNSIQNNGQFKSLSKIKRRHKKGAKTMYSPVLSYTQHSIATKMTEDDSFSLHPIKKNEYTSDNSLYNTPEKQIFLETSTPTKLSHAESVRARVSQYAIDYMKKAGMAKKENAVKAYLDFSRKQQRAISMRDEPIGMLPQVLAKPGLHEQRARLNSDYFSPKKFPATNLTLSTNPDTELSKVMTSPNLSSPSKNLVPIRPDIKRRAELLSQPVRKFIPRILTDKLETCD